MKFTSILILVLFAIGCSQNFSGSIEASGWINHPKEESASGQCVIKEEWLHKDYDYTGNDVNNIPTDFFLLVYSNSPKFCKYKESLGELDDVPFQCSSPNKFGWVIHGLWGESTEAYKNNQKDKHPRLCRGNLDPLKLDQLIPYLCMSPGTKLLQGEWEKHGSCDFETAKAYFEKTEALFLRFKRPPAELDAKNAMQWMKANNPILEDKWLHLTNHEFGICFSNDFEVIPCPRKR